MSLILDMMTILNSTILFFVLYFAYKGYKKVKQPLQAMGDIGKMFNTSPVEEEVEDEDTD